MSGGSGIVTEDAGPVTFRSSATNLSLQQRRQDAKYPLQTTTSYSSIRVSDTEHAGGDQVSKRTKVVKAKKPKVTKVDDLSATDDDKDGSPVVTYRDGVKSTP